MVYRGKPSAGCENCRKAKKRCDLEKPACSRCVKLKKLCSGYRDTSALHIEDESEAVRRKADRQSGRATVVTVDRTKERKKTVLHAIASPHSDSSSSSSDDVIELLPWHGATDLDIPMGDGYESSDMDDYVQSVIISKPVQHKTDDVATTFFYQQFTSSDSHWGMLRTMAKEFKFSPTLSFAIRACGMACLDNLHYIVRGRDMSRAYYAEALKLLNASLRDPEECKTDESLIAVALLGYYENLTCDSRQSIHSWKTHVKGATQLLRLRGKQQLQRPVGQMLFREVRAQILTSCIWDDTEPPPFLVEWNEDLRKSGIAPNFVVWPGDELAELCCDYAKLVARMAYKKISDSEAMALASEIEVKMLDWSTKTMQQPSWRYHQVEVDESPHVWNGIVHSYVAHPAPSVWNTFRSIRIMMTRMQELLYRRMPQLGLSKEQVAEQLSYFRSVRRQMADEICSTVPCALGHAAPAWNSPCPLLSAYSSIWPLHFAGTCILERVSGEPWDNIMSGKGTTTHRPTSAAAAQAAWVIGRMEYISKNIGLRWADGVVAMLKGDFETLDMYKTGIELPEWAEKVKNSGRGPRILLEAESPLSDALNKSRAVTGPIWLGRAIGENEKYGRST